MSGEPRDLGLQDLPGLSGARGWQGPEASTGLHGHLLPGPLQGWPERPAPPPRHQLRGGEGSGAEEAAK